MFDSSKRHRIQLSWLNASESAFVLAYGVVGYVVKEFFWLVDIILGPSYHARCWWVIWVGSG